MRKLAVLLACLFLPLAGCLAGSEDSPVQAATGPYDALPLPAHDTVTTAAEPTTNVTRDDWYVLQALATAEGAIEAYTLPLPDGAGVPAWYDEDSLHHVMEFTFLEAPDIEAWMILIVDISARQVLTTVSGFTTPGQGSFGASAGTPAGSREMGTSHGSDYVYLRGLSDGDELGIVVAAKGSGTADIGVRFAAEDPFSGNSFTWPADSPAEFRKRTSGVAWLPTHAGSGTGLTLDMFYDSENLLLFPYAMRFVVGDMHVDELVPDNPVLQPLNDLRLQASLPDGAGYTTTLVWSWTSAHSGTLEYDLRARSTEPVSGLDVLIPDPVVHSVVAMSVGDGEGPSSVNLHMTYAGAPTVFSKLTILDHLALGASLEDLLGVSIPGASYSRSTLGLEAEGIDRSRLVVDTPAGTRIFQGLFPSVATPA